MQPSNGERPFRVARLVMIGGFATVFRHDQKALGVEAARKLAGQFGQITGATDIPPTERPAVRNDLNHILAELKKVSEAKKISEDDKKTAKSIHAYLMKSAQYAPWWVRILSALCLGLGTMIGYKRIVKTLGSRLGKQHLVPAQGASAELVAAVLIGGAGFTGFPVSTTHVVTGGIAGTMVGSGAGIVRCSRPTEPLQPLRLELGGDGARASRRNPTMIRAIIDDRLRRV